MGLYWFVDVRNGFVEQFAFVGKREAGKSDPLRLVVRTQPRSVQRLRSKSMFIIATERGRACERHTFSAGD